jgi:hypothetical protein
MDLPWSGGDRTKAIRLATVFTGWLAWGRGRRTQRGRQIITCRAEAKMKTNAALKNVRFMAGSIAHSRWAMFAQSVTFRAALLP